MKLSRAELIKIIKEVIGQHPESYIDGIFLDTNYFDRDEDSLYRITFVSHKGLVSREWSDGSIFPTREYSAVEGIHYTEKYIPWDDIPKREIESILTQSIQSLDKLEMHVSAQTIRLKYGL